jgi:hypothetical protein
MLLASPKPATWQSLKHARAIHLLEGGDIRMIQEPIGHKVVTTSMIYCRRLGRGELGVGSALNRITGLMAEPATPRIQPRFQDVIVLSCKRAQDNNSRSMIPQANPNTVRHLEAPAPREHRDYMPRPTAHPD